MALIINKSNLVTTNGGLTLPSTNILVRFLFHSSLKGLDLANDVKYYLSTESESDGWSPIYITYLKPILDGEGNPTGETEKITLPNAIYKSFDNAEIGRLEGVVNSSLPNSSTFEKLLFSHHLIIKEKLEEILGEGTVDIRLDLI